MDFEQIAEKYREAVKQRNITLSAARYDVGLLQNAIATEKAEREQFQQVQGERRSPAKAKEWRNRSLKISRLETKLAAAEYRLTCLELGMWI